MVGGRITVAAGWDSVCDLDTVEYYDEKLRRWRDTASMLQFERQWPASTPISLSLFPKCVQKEQEAFNYYRVKAIFWDRYLPLLLPHLLI